MEVESKILLIFFSTFGSAFREAAKNLNVKTMHDGFETAMIELKKLEILPIDKRITFKL